MKTNLLFSFALLTFTPLALGASFDSAASGDWSALGSWTSGVATPDVFDADSATIHSSHSVDYDSGMSTPAGLVGTGGFAVANGNSVTIDGGVLTQAIRTDEIRIGEGTGTVSGTGTLTIRNGGQMDTGASIAMVVGSKISGVQAGDGVLNVEDGTLVLGAGASTGGLGIGVDESAGVANIGDGVGTPGSATLDLAAHNIVGVTGAAFVGIGGTGTINVDSDGRILFGSSLHCVGDTGGTGQMTLVSGATMTGGTGSLIFGNGTGSSGSLVNEGVIGTTGEIRIGSDAGTGSATMSQGSISTTAVMSLGSGSGAVGNLDLSGTGAIVANNFHVGNNGAVGHVTQSGGSITSHLGVNMADGGGAAGTSYDLSGGSLTVETVGLEMGRTRDAAMNITGNGTLSVGGNYAIFGSHANAQGTLTLANTGIININTGSGIILGYDQNAVGTFTQTGGTLNMNGHHLQIGGSGGSGTGTYNISAGTVNNVGWFHVGSGVGSLGTINVNFTNPAATLSGSELYLGTSGGTGVTNVTSGNFSINNVAEIGRYTGTGTLNVTGPDARVTGGAGGGDPFFKVGRTSGHGFVNISGGAKLHTTNTWFTLGEFGGSEGATGEATVTGMNSELHSNGLIVGWNGHTTGILNVQDNANVINVGHELSVGRDHSYTEGIINIDTGGTLTTFDARVGHNGLGTVNIDNGTFHSNNGWAVIGDQPTAVGVVNLSSGTFTVDSANPGDGTLIVANSVGSQGTLNQSGGTTNISNELNLARGGGTGVVTVAGGQMNVNGWTTMGRDGGSGTGTLNVTTGGIFNHPQLGGDLLLGWTNGSTGNLNVTDGGQMTYNWWIRGGIDAGSTGNLIVDGAGSLLSHNDGSGGDSRLVTGEAGTGTLQVSNAGQINDGGNGFFVGWHAGGNGSVSVNSGGGIAVKTGWIQVGIEAGSTGDFTIDGVGSLVTHDLSSAGYSTAIGQAGTGTLTISNGGQMNDTAARFLVGRDNGGSGVVNVTSGGTLIHLPTVDPNDENWMMIIGGTHEGGVPIGGLGVMNVDSGSAVQTNSFDAGRRTPAGGTLNVTDSAFTASGHFSTGRGSNGLGGSTPGLVSISNSTLSYGAWLSVGHEGGSGLMDINSSSVTGNGDFNVGIDQNGQPSPTVGVVNMNGASSVTVPTMPIGRNGGTGTFNEFSGVVNVSNEVNVGNGGATTVGTLNVDGAGASFLAGTVGDPFMFVGRGGAHGYVNVSNGGSLSTTNTWFTMGNGDGSVGETTVTGAGSTLSSRGLIVGWNGSGMGTLNIYDNAVVTNVARELSVGRDQPNTSGIVNIGSGGVLNAGPETRIGHNGIGVVNIDGGTMNMQGGGWAILGDGGAAFGTLNLLNGLVNVTADRFVLGQNAGSIGVYNQDQGSTQIGNEFNVGRGSGTGTLNLNGGTMNVNGWTTLGRDGSGTGTINVSNGAVFTHLQSSGDMLAGWNNGSTGNINITTGGSMTYNWWFRAGIDPGSHGNVLVDGAGSEIVSTTGRIYIGERGTGTLSVTNGGSFRQYSGDEFNVGGNNNSANGEGDGMVNIVDGEVSSNKFIRVGFGNTGADPAVGVVNFDGGIFNSGGWIGFGHEGGDGTLNMTGGTLSTGTEFYVGIDDNGHAHTTTGEANISGGTVTVGTTLWVGRNGGTGTMNILAPDPLSITVAGRTAIGEGGVGSGGAQTHGILNFDNADAVLTTNRFEVAINGAQGDMTLDHGTINVGSEYVSLGRNGGTGVLNMNGGTLNYNNWFTLGHEDGSGTLNMVGGTINGTGDFDLAVAGGTTNIGVVNQSGGSIVIVAPGNVVIGRDNAGEATYNLLAGLVEAPEVQVARNTSNASKTGVLNALGGTIFTNDIHIDTLSSAGTVNFDGVTVKAKSNQANFFRNFTTSNSELFGVGLIFDSNGFQVTAPNTFDGAGGVSKIGTGTFILTAANEYDGGTDITVGTLLANNLSGSATGSGPVTVSGTGTLGGTGNVDGAIQASTGGTVSPGASVGTLSTSSVAFLAPSTFRVEIDDSTIQKSDTLLVSGNLNITGATLNLSVVGVAAEPVYVIATYGSRTGSFASVSGLPSGYTLDYDYSGSSAIALVQSTTDPFTTWINGFPGLTPAEKAKLADPDNDGVSNLLEFALGGSAPNNGGARPPILPSLDGTNHFVITTLVRSGAFAVFSGLPSPTNSPAIDNLTYAVEGTVDLLDWTKDMEVTSLPGGLPAAPLGWEWASFRHVQAASITDHSGARVRVTCP